MTRRMSVALTLPAVRDKSKTVTRRREDTWRTLKTGDRLTLVEKAQGLPKGARQVAVDEVTVVDVRDETLRQVTDAEVRAEGLWDRALAECHILAAYVEPEEAPVVWFRRFWAMSHGYGDDMLPQLGIPCRRIEWKYDP